MSAYYNEIDQKAAEWLRELIKAGLIAPGVVDERSIIDVNPYELTQYTQHHFFAGIGGWSYALRLAEWPDDKPAVTGSCPCQPFSAAGQQLGTKDERHLWPVFYNIITFLGAPIVFGEQVASPIALQWLDGVFANLEGAGYACGAADLCAAGVDAPHIRQRLYWMAHANGGKSGNRRIQPSRKLGQQPKDSGTIGLADPDSMHGPQYVSQSREWRKAGPSNSAKRSSVDRLAATEGEGRARMESECTEGQRERSRPWSHCTTINCTDGKTRIIEPSVQPLAHGIPDRVGLLRGYGNAIVPQVAAEFIQAATESLTT